MIKVYFKGVWCCGSNFCNCTVGDFFYLSHIEAIDSVEKYFDSKYRMFDGNKDNEWEALVAVFWDLVADQSKYDDFYDMCESFDDIEESEIKLMLLTKGIEVIFLEEE